MRVSASRLLLGTLLLAGATLEGTPRCFAGMVIVRTFTGGGSAPGNAIGGGTFAGVMNQAADYWEAQILDTHTVTINFQWGAQSGGTLAAHTLLAQGGVPNRETSARIIFDNDGSSAFFMDPTPALNEEYGTFTQSFANLGGGVMNTGRVFTGATGLASGRSDLLAVALHEIGHSLGLSASNTSYQAETNADNDIDVIGPRPFAGAVIPTTNTAATVPPGSFNAHINIGTSLMFPSIPNSTRRLITDVDIVANAEISDFNSLNVSIPEPSSLILVGFGALGAAGYGWRRRRAA